MTSLVLPTYQRFINGMPVPFSRRTFRHRERYIIILVVILFGVVCFGTFLYAPEMYVNPSGDSMYKVYDHMKRVGPEFLMPPPPLQIQSPYRKGDIEKLQAKMDEDDTLYKVLERPVVQKLGPSSSTAPTNLKSNQGLIIPRLKTVDENVGQEELDTRIVTVPPFPGRRLPVITKGDDADAKANLRRNKVKEMMKHAWDNYVRYAWGKNELKPKTKRGHTASVFGSVPLAATILDGMDTLFIMGMHDEFKQAREWVANEFDLSKSNADVSVFETNIRFVGGLLACYALTGDILFRERAQQIADKLMPAFDTPSGIPFALVNLGSGVSRNFGWASSGSSILSEFGTLHLEFAYLSDVTGNPKYRDKVDGIRRVLMKLDKPNGLYPNYLNPKTSKWGQYHMSMGALGDSFFEYLLKAWIQSNYEDTEARKIFDDAMQSVLQHMLFTSPTGMMYFAELKFEQVEHKMDHLACFAGGLLALASVTAKNEYSKRYLDVAKNITNTCHESYVRTATKLGPESFRFNDANEAIAQKSSEKYYILRPEVIESYFYLYRITKDEKYREWGWEAVEALEKICRVDGGFSGIKNVYSSSIQHDDVQQSYFLAETLKYLYLLFSDDSLISLKEWVFNTEGHPLPIKGVNSLYRPADV